MTSQKKAFLTILVSFLLGGVAGVFVDQAFLGRSFRVVRSSNPYEKFKTRVFKDLDLSASQQAQLEQVLQRRQEAFNDFRKNIEAKYLEMRGSTRDSIRSLLSPAQLVKFEALVKEFDATYRREEKK